MEKVLILLQLLWAATCFIDLSSLSALELSLLPQNSLIRVEKAYHSLPPSLQDHQNLYYSLSAKHRNKRKAYQLFLYKQDKIFGFLGSRNIRETASMIVKSKVKARYVPKLKQWEFKVDFAFVIEARQTNEVKRKIEQLDGKTLDELSHIEYLDLKWIALKLLFAAKLELESCLQGSQFYIADIVALKLIGEDETYLRIEQELAYEMKDELESRSLLVAGGGEESKQSLDVRIEVIFQVKPRKLEYK